MGNKSTPIFKLGLAGIIISVVIMQCTGFVIQGFKAQISSKIAIYNGYGQIESAISSRPYLYQSDSLQSVLNDAGIQSNAFLRASATIQTKTGIKSVALNGFESLPSQWNCQDSNAVYVSHALFQGLALNSDSTTNIIVATNNDNYTIRKIKIIPAFESFLEDIDQKTAYTYLSKLQEITALGGSLKFASANDTITVYSKNNQLVSINGIVYEDSKFTLPSKWPLNVEMTDNNGFLFAQNITESDDEMSNHHLYVDAVRIENEIKNQNRLELLLPFDVTFTSSAQLYPQLFNWLKLLYTNVAVIICLVLGIALINNSSVLLVLIIEKTNLIAILKALGATDAVVKKVFSFTSFRLNVKALIIGNIISLIIAFTQWQWHWLALNPKDYFVDEVPFSFDISFFAGISLAALILPVLVSYLPLKILKKMNVAELLRLN